MKRLLLTGAMLMALSFSAKAQSLYSENFDDLTVGDVGTDLTGETPGQGDIFTFVNAGGENSDFQIIADGYSDKGFSVSAGDVPSGTTQATDNARWSWANAVGAAWQSREEGNDFFTAEYYFNSAVVEGSTSLHRAVLLAATTGRVMGGFQYDAATSELTGVIYFSQNNQAGTYTISFAEGDGLIIPQNEWIRLGFAVSPATGQVLWSSPDILVEDQETGDQVPFVGSFTSSFAANSVPAEFDFVSLPGPDNQAVSTAKYDGVSLLATNADLDGWLLNTTPVVAQQNQVSVFPNPSNGVINIANVEGLKNASIADINGRTVKTVNFAGTNQINISDLANGVYMMTINSDKGSVTKKIVKN